MPFDKIFSMRPSKNPGTIDGGTTYVPTIDLTLFGTYPNGIIIQVLQFEGYSGTNTSFLQLRFQQITSPELYGSVILPPPKYKVLAIQTQSNTGINDQYWFALAKPAEPIKLNGYANTNVIMTIMLGDDGLVTDLCEMLIRIRIIGF